jgi:carbon-monoxide dehydrogenase catalytic subunit
LTDFAATLQAGEISPKSKREAEKAVQDIRGLLENGDISVMKKIPKSLADNWKALGVYPDGVGRALFKASQKLDGGVGSLEDTFLWIFKAALAGWAAQLLQGRLKAAVFGETAPAAIEVNLGVLRKDAPNILFCGHFSPVVKRKIAEAAKGKKIGILSVCSDPSVPPYTFSPVANYGSQEIPLMSGAATLIVAGDQCVNPSLIELAKAYKVGIVSTEMLHHGKTADFARQVVEKAGEEYEAHGEGAKDIPEIREAAVMGFSTKHLDPKKIVDALEKGKIKGIVVLAGCNNVKFTQDQEMVTIARSLLKDDVLCVSEGCASVGLAKYGLLNAKQKETNCGKGLSGLLSSLGKNMPAVVDLGSCENGGVSEFFFSLANTAKKGLKDLPVAACFPEANRSKAVARAAWTVAMGIPTYFWPFLPVTGSPKMMDRFGTFCEEKFGARLHILPQKMEAREKAALVMKSLKKA